MSFLRSYKREIIWLFFLGICYFAIRLYQLGSLPIFTDEAIYLHWATVAKSDAAQRFISLTDGKQPMFIWLTMTTLYFIKDPLLAGRMVSVFAGFLTMIGLFFFGNELYRNKKVGLYAATLYLLFPMALVYDRMAMYDSLVGTFCIWGLYVSLLLVRYVRLDIAFVLAFVLGGGMLTKTNAFFTAAFLPFSLLFFDWKEKGRKRRFIQWAGYALLAFIIAYGYYSILRLSPFFYIIGQKNAEFVLPLTELIKNPFIYFPGNVAYMFNWFVTYVTIPFLLTGLVGLYYGKKQWKQFIFVFLCFIVPFVYLAAVGKIIYARYILFMVLPLLPFIAYSFYMIETKIKKSMIFYSIFACICLWAGFIDFKIVTNIVSAPIPFADHDQFITGWAAGGGVKEAIAFFDTQAADKKIYIATQGTFGLMPYALEIYLLKNPNITIQGYWPLDGAIPMQLLANAKKMPTYVLFYQPCPSCMYAGIAPTSWKVEQVLQIEKSTNIFLTVYKIPEK